MKRLLIISLLYGSLALASAPAATAAAKSAPLSAAGQTAAQTTSSGSAASSAPAQALQKDQKESAAAAPAATASESEPEEHNLYGIFTIKAMSAFRGGIQRNEFHDPMGNSVTRVSEFSVLNPGIIGEWSAEGSEELTAEDKFRILAKMWAVFDAQTRIVLEKYPDAMKEYLNMSLTFKDEPKK